jgi:serine/threonine protein kinase
MASDPDRDAPVREGDVLAGRYRVERVLAAGGMGIVVAARHMQLNQRVAVKVLTHNVGSTQAIARFLTEAKASALLRSEHVVHVSDVGTLESGQPFMVMELLDGDDLSQVLEGEGRLSVEQAVDYLLQACEGLAEAHAARIVHRDLKPGNLFRARRPDGSNIIKVLDFGVSKALSTDVRAEGTVTTTDQVFGSPLYMSPEQMQSASKADERSDIWSLGVLLYELVSHKMPFDAESMAGLAVRIATDPPTRLVTVLPSVPLELEGVIFKCLEKDPNNRYANIAEFAADLEPFAPGCRPQVERIQRLLFGATNPPRAAPSAPSMRRIVPVGAETLGPIDQSESSSPAVVVMDRKRRAWPVAVAVAVTVGVALTTAIIVRSVTVSSVSPPVAAQPNAVPPPTLTAPPSTAPGETSAIAPVHVDPPVATATATTQRPHVRQNAVSSSSGGGHPSASSSTVLSGISRDRK